MRTLPTRLAVAAVALTAGLAACSVSTNDDPVAVRGPFDRLVQSTTTSSTTPPEGGARDVDVYYLRTPEGGASELVAVPREVAADAGVQQVLAILIPRVQPTERGLSTSIPDSAVLLGTTPLADDVVAVNTRGLFGQSGIQNPQLRQALGQIVCTATELPSVNAVRFQNEGRDVSASIEDSDVDRPVDCSDYDELT
jgi:spore germination protein GerM